MAAAAISGRQTENSLNGAAARSGGDETEAKTNVKYDLYEQGSSDKLRFIDNFRLFRASDEGRMESPAALDDKPAMESHGAIGMVGDLVEPLPDAIRARLVQLELKAKGRLPECVPRYPDVDSLPEPSHDPRGQVGGEFPYSDSDDEDMDVVEDGATAVNCMMGDDGSESIPRVAAQPSIAPIRLKIKQGGTSISISGGGGSAMVGAPVGGGGASRGLPLLHLPLPLLTSARDRPPIITRHRQRSARDHHRSESLVASA